MALGAIAQVQAKAGLMQDAAANIAYAVRLAQFIKGELTRVFAVGVIAQEQARAGMTEEALQLALSIKDVVAAPRHSLSKFAVLTRAGDEGGGIASGGCAGV